MSDIIELVVCSKKGIVDENNRGKIERKTHVVDLKVPEAFKKEHPEAPNTVKKEIDDYAFYATKEETTTEQPADQIREVTLSIPLGGQENGLFRYPHIGEHVLVVCQGNQNYLMAYLPSKNKSNDFELTTEEVMETENGFFAIPDENTSLCDSEAQVLRYRKKGSFRAKNGNDTACSEIGFYRGKSSFATSRSDVDEKECATTYQYIDKNGTYQNTECSPGEVPEGMVDKAKAKITKYPMIDKLSIQCAGDITTTSQNANEVNAQRVLIQSTFLDAENVKYAGDITAEDYKILEKMGDYSKKIEEYNYRKEKGLDTAGIKNDKLLKDITDLQVKLGARHNKFLMPNKTGITDLGKGDICLNADGNITLNARESITFKVGANKIKIDKTGISISTGSGLGLVPGPFDATLSISNDGSISIGGKKFTASVEESFGVSDAMGGNVASSLGVLSLTGLEVGASTLTGGQNIYNTVNWGYSKILEIMSMCANQGQNLSNVSKAYEIMAKIQGYAGAIGGAVVGVARDSHAYNSKGELFNYNNTMMIPLLYTVIWGILGPLQSSLKTLRMTKDGIHYENGQYYSKLHQEDGKKGNDVDKINRLFQLDLGFMITQMIIIAGIKTLMIVQQKAVLKHNASYKLGCDASASLEAMDYYQNTVNTEEIVSLTAGLQVGNYAQPENTEEESQRDENGNIILTGKTYANLGYANAVKVGKTFNGYVKDGENQKWTKFDKAIDGKLADMIRHKKGEIDWSLFKTTSIATTVVTAAVCGINEGCAQNCIATEEATLAELGDL